MIYNSWTVQPNILLRLSSVPHECWGCIDTFFGFPRIFNVKLCPWRGMAYHGGTHFLRVCIEAVPRTPWLGYGLRSTNPMHGREDAR